MRNKQLEFHRNPAPDKRQSELLVKDILQYLAGLAKLYEGEKTGNIEFARGLRHFATSLRPYSDVPISELASALNGRESAGHPQAASRRAESTLPPELESIGQEEIERILEDENYTKSQLVELGFRRFGLSRSKLGRLRKEDALESVRAALGHEKSLDAISREARKDGKARSN